MEQERGVYQGDQVASRIERLERLDELRGMGAITDAEYEQEKAKTLNSTAEKTNRLVAHAGSESEGSTGEAPTFVSSIRHSWVNSSLGENKSLAAAVVVGTTLLVGVVLRSVMVGGVWLAVCSAGAYWLYTGLRLNQKSELDHDASVWRALFYVGCGAIILAFVSDKLPWQSGNTPTAVASVEEEGSNDPVEATQSSDEVSDLKTSSANPQMSCKSAMEIASVASCGIQLENLKAGNHLSFGLDSYRAQTGGYQQSLNQTMLRFDCQDAVSTGRNAATAGLGDAWDALSSQQVDMRTAVRMCGLGAKPIMDQFCEYNAASCLK